MCGPRVPGVASRDQLGSHTPRRDVSASAGVAVLSPCLPSLPRQVSSCATLLPTAPFRKLPQLLFAPRQFTGAQILGDRADPLQFGAQADTQIFVVEQKE